MECSIDLIGNNMIINIEIKSIKQRYRVSTREWCIEVVARTDNVNTSVTYAAKSLSKAKKLMLKNLPRDVLGIELEVKKEELFGEMEIVDAAPRKRGRKHNSIDSKVDYIIFLCKATEGPDFYISPHQISILERCIKHLQSKNGGEFDVNKVSTINDLYLLVRDQSGFDAYALAMVLKEVIVDLSKVNTKTKDNGIEENG